MTLVECSRSYECSLRNPRSTNFSGFSYPSNPKQLWGKVGEPAIFFPLLPGPDAMMSDLDDLENIADSWAFSPAPSRILRKGHAVSVCCPKGHPWTRENTLVSGGRRFCRECARLRYKPRRA